MSKKHHPFLVALDDDDEDVKEDLNASLKAGGVMPGGLHADEEGKQGPAHIYY